MLIWTIDGLGGLICYNCGTSNPDSGDRCGNCGENPRDRPQLMTRAQKYVSDAIKTGMAIYHSA